MTTVTFPHTAVRVIRQYRPDVKLPVLNTVVLLSTFGVVKPIQCANKIRWTVSCPLGPLAYSLCISV